MPQGEVVFDGIKAFRCFLRECVKEPQPLSYFVELEARRLGISKHQKAYHALYMRIYRLVKELEAQGLLRIEKLGNTLFISAPLDLIKAGGKIGTTKEESEESENPLVRYRRKSEEWREAAFLMWSTEWGEEDEWEEIKGVIEESDKEIQDLFRAWLELSLIHI